MNNVARRQLVKARVIDVSVAKTTVNESRRRRNEAAMKLRKELAALQFSNRAADVVSYSRHALG